MKKTITITSSAALALGILLAPNAFAEPKFCHKHEDPSIAASDHEAGSGYITACSVGNGGTPYHLERLISGKVVRVDGPIDSNMTDGIQTP